LHKPKPVTACLNPLLRRGTTLQLPAKMRHHSFRFHSSSSILYSICIFIALLQHSQVRSETLSGYVSCCPNSLAWCVQGCLYVPVTEVWVGIFQEPESGPQSNGVVDILDCPIPADNACYCNSDQSQLATSGISSCIRQDCTGMGLDEISTAIQWYTNYCSALYVEDAMVTAATGSGATSESFLSSRNPERFTHSPRFPTDTTLLLQHQLPPLLRLPHHNLPIHQRLRRLQQQLGVLLLQVLQHPIHKTRAA
jgi:hypothetical protein